MYKKHACNSPSGGDLHLERWSIPMIGPNFPPLTLKIVEHSRYLPLSVWSKSVNGGNLGQEPILHTFGEG